MATEKSPAEVKALLEAQGMNPDRHNWMYAFMSTDHEYVAGMYLLAYCKQCDQSMSVIVPIEPSGEVRLHKLGIPKVGCDWGGE